MAKKPEDRFASAGDLAIAANAGAERPGSGPGRDHPAAQVRTRRCRACRYPRAPRPTDLTRRRRPVAARHHRRRSQGDACRCTAARPTRRASTPPPPAERAAQRADVRRPPPPPGPTTGAPETAFRGYRSRAAAGVCSCSCSARWASGCWSSRMIDVVIGPADHFNSSRRPSPTETTRRTPRTTTPSQRVRVVRFQAAWRCCRAATTTRVSRPCTRRPPARWRRSTAARSSDRRRPGERPVFVVRRSADPGHPLRRRHQAELRAFQGPPGSGAGLADHVALHRRRPHEVEGRIACGTYNNGPDLV